MNIDINPYTTSKVYVATGLILSIELSIDRFAFVRLILWRNDLF